MWEIKVTSHLYEVNKQYLFGLLFTIKAKENSYNQITLQIF